MAGLEEPGWKLGGEQVGARALLAETLVVLGPQGCVCGSRQFWQDGVIFPPWCQQVGSMGVLVVWYEIEGRMGGMWVWSLEWGGGAGRAPGWTADGG